MRSNLVDGRLVPPPSVTSGQLRQQQLAHEIGKLEASLAEHSSESGREAWAQRARGNLGWLRKEERLLRGWLLVRGVEILPPRGGAPAPSREDDFEAFWRD